LRVRDSQQSLACRTNLEDDCKGRFWEGRFQSQALLDEAGLLTAMAYVDLNPIRAGIAKTPEESEFTSIYARIRELRAVPEATEAVDSEKRVPLLAFRPVQDPFRKAIPFDVRSYLELVDWTGRRIVEGKCGSIDERLPPILHRLGIQVTGWERMMQPHGNVFGRALGRVGRLRQHARILHQCWIRGLGWSRRLYGM
jgi:hypothetical protein